MGHLIEEEELESLDNTEEDLNNDDPDDDNLMIHLSSMHNPYKTSIFPTLIINKKLKIIYINEACEQMFSGSANLTGKYFFELFENSFESDDAKKIKEALISGGGGFSWKGSAQINMRKAGLIQTRVYIYPLELDITTPGDFVVMFDDFSAEKKKLLRSIFLSLLEASRLKDNDTKNHTTRVSEYSKRLTEELFKIGGEAYKKIDADFIDNICFLAAMHDIGKIGTPDDIINKEGPLTDWEWIVMREHPKNGAYILSTYPNPMAKEIALSHHEKWDGSGYPFQIEGEMIPLAARIVSIADAYDALRVERSYKPSLTHEVSVQKMIEESGSHFDPELIEVFKKISDDFGKIYETYPD